MCKGSETDTPISQGKRGRFQFSLHSMMVAVAVVSVTVFLAREFGGLLYDLFIRDLTAQGFQRFVGMSNWFVLTPELRVRFVIATIALESIFLWCLTPRIAVAVKSHSGNFPLLVAFLALAMIVATVTLVSPGRILDTNDAKLDFELGMYLAAVLMAIALFPVYFRAMRFCRRTFVEVLGKFRIPHHLSKHMDTLERRNFEVRIGLLLIPFSLALTIWWTTLPSRTWETFVSYVEKGKFDEAENLLADDQLVKIVYRGRRGTPFWTICGADGTYVISYNATSKQRQFKVSDLAPRTIADVFLARNRAYEFTIKYKSRKFGYFEVRGSKLYFIARPQLSNTLP